MGKKKQSLPCDIKGIEEWMNQFFQDPFTSFLDDYTFRVDLFETSCEYIIEAQINHVEADEISVEINNDNLSITIHSIKEEKPKERSVVLPFPLEDKRIDAIYQNGILEIKIAKEEKTIRNNKRIQIQKR